MKNSLIRLLRLFSSFFGLLVILHFFSNSLAASDIDESLTPREILYSKLESFFGELRGTFRFPDEKLFQQVASGLEEYDLLSEQPVVQLPRVGDNLYLETGSTAHDYPLFSAVVITSSERVVSAALLDSAGLAIFLRSSPENRLYVATFKKWAQVIWCSENPVYAGLGFGIKLNQTFKPSDCRPLDIKEIYLSGYNSKSVN